MFLLAISRRLQNGFTSAITKRLVDGHIKLTSLGLAGDEQAEKGFHGGPDRAFWPLSSKNIIITGLSNFLNWLTYLMLLRLVKIFRLPV